MPETIFTIGHSTRTLEELTALLHAHGIHKLIDVRTVPRSRTNPQFNRDTLPDELAQGGIGYAHDARLGGLRHPRKDSINTGWKNKSFRGYADHMETPEFREALDDLAETGATARLAIMCAEAVPWRCHRTLIADALTARSIAVNHIMGEEKLRPHETTRFARIESGRVSYPG